MGSIGAAAIPGAGIVPIILVLQSLELPTRDISLIIGIDWLM
jgi:Na+/H+-dicarboxylate symporter